MNLVFVSSEVAPYSKSGGLADVVGSLAGAMARAGHRVICVSPRYRDVPQDDLKETGIGWGFHLGVTLQSVRYRTRRDDNGVLHVFIEHPVYERIGLYGDARGSFGDNHLRFALLCRAALEAARRVPYDEDGPLGEEVLFHCHDWQTALLPVILEAVYRPVGLFSRAATVLTIHNLAHQGLFPASSFSELELPARWFAPWALEFHEHINLLKAGILHAEQITTVSPSYAREIRSSQGGFRLDGVLHHRRADLNGILNGIDTDLWDPATDPFLAAPYSSEDMAGKAVCKAALQKQLGLPVEPDVPLIASVGRLDPQKGMEMVLESLPWAVNTGAQLVFLGTAAASHQHYEWRLREAEQTWPTQVRAWIGFSEEMAHKMLAGADLFSMPSLFEPCGLTQLYAMRYGTVPLVRAVGGLADTVTPYDPLHNTGTGWVFREARGEAYRNAIHEALYTYRHHRESFDAIRARGMERDGSWNVVAPDYLRVYKRALGQRKRGTESETALG